MAGRRGSNPQATIRKDVLEKNKNKLVVNAVSETLADFSEDLVWIYKRIGGGIALWDGCVKPMVCALVCAVVGYFSYGAMATKLPVGLSCILAIALAGVVYVVMALITRLMNSEDTKVFPGGKYIDRIILKLKR